MRHRILFASIIWTFCAIAGRAQSGPDNDPDAAPGYVNSVFHHGQVDSINLYNGQLTIPISLGPTYPVGPKLKFQAVLTYSSRKNDYGHPTIQPPDYVYYPFVGQSGAGAWLGVHAGSDQALQAGQHRRRTATSGRTEASTCSIRGQRPGDGSQLYLTGIRALRDVGWRREPLRLWLAGLGPGRQPAGQPGLHPRLRHGPRRMVPDLGDGPVRKLLFRRLLHGRSRPAGVTGARRGPAR